jgi:hypothetical protein
MLDALLVDVLDVLILQTVLANKDMEPFNLTSDLGTYKSTVVN